jgi:glutamate synthase domain-containing protein 1
VQVRLADPKQEKISFLRSTDGDVTALSQEVCVLSGPRESCGVFGVYAPNEDVARLVFYGLYALQHRGQESAGIATADGHGIHLHLGMGLVSQVFDEEDLKHLPGNMAIGHNRTRPPAPVA